MNSNAKQEFDNLIRDRSWNSFRARLEELCDSEVVVHPDDVVASANHANLLHSIEATHRFAEHADGPSKSESTREFIASIVESNTRQSTHKTMLHSLCDIESKAAMKPGNHATSKGGPPPSDIIRLVANSSPSSIFIQDGNHGNRTPLHLAIARRAGLDVIRVLIEAATDYSRNHHPVLKRIGCVPMRGENKGNMRQKLSPAKKDNKTANIGDRKSHHGTQGKHNSKKAKKSMSLQSQQRYEQSPIHSLLYTTDSKGMTPLLLASKIHDHPAYDEILKYLVDADFDSGGSGISLLLPQGVSWNQRKNFSSTRPYHEIRSGVIVCDNKVGGVNGKGAGGFPLAQVACKEALLVGQGLDGPDLLRFMIGKTYRAVMCDAFPNYFLVDEDSGGRIGSELGEPSIHVESDAGNGKACGAVEKYEFRNRDVNELPVNVDKDNEAISDVCLLQATIVCYNLLGSMKTASSILSYIIRNDLFQRSRLMDDRDAMGNLTIHIACLVDGPAKFDQILKLGDRISDYGINAEDCTLMEYLVSNSQSRDLPHPSPLLCNNFEGDLPIHCAVKSRKEWDHIQLLIDVEPSSLRTCNSSGELPLHLAIKMGCSNTFIRNMWSYYPEAASVVDSSLGLYPFQLAAVGRHDNKELCRNRDLDTFDIISLSFFFLRESPYVMAQFTS